MPVPDIFREGMQKGWRVFDGNQRLPELPAPDVIIIGSGAGGATAAEILSAAGLQVYILEEGSLKTSSDFHNDELKAYAELYQEGALRTSADGGIAILQGRTVGGTTTVNWTSSFRTPNSTLAQWQSKWGIDYATEAEMTPWFERMEQRLNVSRWQMAPNANNDVIRKGCEALNWDWDIIPRNVKGCWNLGYCGTGCPVNAKQSMLVTSLPAALENGAVLIHSLRAVKLDHHQGKVLGVQCQGMNGTLTEADGRRFTLTAPNLFLAGGAINNPGLLLRSKAPDPHQQLGKRTFLHPVCMTLATFPRAIDGFYGAPQSVYSDHFNEVAPTSERMGFKLEVPPMQPSIVAALMGGFGEQHFQRIQDLAKSNLMLALMRDGFFEDDLGGQVKLRKNGDAVVDYPLRDRLWATVAEAYVKMAEIQFAAGATEVTPLHIHGTATRSLSEFKAQLAHLAYEPVSVRLSSAHVMGGCPMGADATMSVVNPQGQHHQLQNLYVMDGSLFPTSVGANPQLSIYALVARLATNFLA
ncbi:GMC family oxidoreductase [Aliidiomarina iranensis]|uniref:GMC family oxidoreductase n=1 Tax=Aliidiomarina iranensis TaxID=1434071 RepID=A0A432W221_9GAMM|nr:GMC family oxidoreductase [Aliidiomarina iranensis]RUO23238.1 GMC family oxidoreductase [Aliidiomarina iranensis]